MAVECDLSDPQLRRWSQRVTVKCLFILIGRFVAPEILSFGQDDGVDAQMSLAVMYINILTFAEQNNAPRR